MNSNQEWQTQLAFGQEGEHIVASLLIASGSYTILPLYQFLSCSFAPQIYTASGSLTSPDLVAMKSGKVMFVECKRKRRWIRWNERVETGLNRKHFQAYLELSQVTGIPLFLFFIHEEQEPTGIYAISLCKTGSMREWNGRNDYTGAYVTKPEVFFASESLTKLA